MLKLAKRIAIISISILLIFTNLIGLADASNLYEPGVIYERYSIPEGRVILCRVNPQTGMDEKSLDDGETWIVVGGEFDDIQNSWCEDEIKICYKSGILRGKSCFQFAPYETLSNAQVLVMAARLNGYWKGRQDIWEPISASEYADYLVDNGVLLSEAFVRYPQAACTRYDFSKVLYAVTPDDYLIQINEIMEILDTKDKDIEDLYAAGILSAQGGNPIYFEGEREITRGAAATIVARLVDSEQRVKI